MSKVCIIQYNASKFLTRVDRAARTLGEAGYEVVLVAIKDEDTPEFEQRDGYVVRRVTLKSRRYTRRFGIKYLRFLEGIWRTFRGALAEDADIYDARDAYPLLGCVARGPDAPARSSSTTPTSSPQGATGPTPANPVVRVGDPHLRALLLPSRRRGDHLGLRTRGRDGAPHRIPRPVVVLNVPEVMPDLEPDPEFAAEARGDRRYVLIYQGIVVMNRGLPEMVEAMRALPDCRLAIVGYGSLLEKLKDQVAVGWSRGRGAVLRARAVRHADALHCRGRRRASSR